MKLFELTAQFKALEALGDSEEIAPEVLRDTLEALEGDFEVKAVAVAKFILSLEASASAIDDAAEAMALRAIRLEMRARSMRAYLLFHFQMFDFKKIETPELIIARKNNPVAVQVSDESVIPENYWVQPEPPPKRIDKKLIKAALQGGAAIPGCFLESGERVDIKL